MNNISEQILQAVDILTDAKLSKLKYDRTVRAIIYSITDVDSGIYYVKFEGNILTAYAEDVEKKYKIGEEVYVRIPEGDFSNKKIIAGRVTELSLSQGQMNQLANSVIDISPTFDKFYSFDTDSPWKVIAGAPQAEDSQGIDYIYGREDNTYSDTQFHGLFQQYANKYEYIRIKADFKTQFHDVHTQGNYGIEIAFFTKGDNDTVNTVTYRLDLESFSGDPYSLSVFSPQQIVLKTQTNYLLGVKYIKLFQNEFKYDTQINDYETGDRTQITDIPNIFVQNIQINYVDVIDLAREPYYCYIATPKGNIFSPLATSIDLEARLLSYGESINSNECRYKWFKRDLSILIGNDLYDKNAGFGWIPIDNDKTLLAINSDDVIHQQRYKCIVTYNDKVIMSAEKEILNSDSNYAYHIEQITEGDTIKLQLINDKTNDVLVGNWYISYPDGSYSFIQEGNFINIQDFLTYTSVVFYCAVYSYDKENIVGTIEHGIFNSESKEDVTIDYVGEDTFRYDANGDITIEDSEKERTIQVQLAWKEGYGTSYRVQWIGPDGEDIPKIKPTSSEDGYKPKDSMIENVWVDNTNILHYNIKYKYKVNYNNNTFTVRIITIDEKIYTFNKEILFIKDGDQGTNGTTYITAVRPCGRDGNKLSRFQALHYNNNDWINSLDLRCYVYKDGELINSNSNYAITYKWSSVGVTINQDDTDRITVNGNGSISADSAGADLQRYVKVSTQIRDNINDRDTMIYALYPIDVVYGDLLDELINIDDIPSYIKYTASGINPSFYSNNIIFKYNKQDYTGDSITTGVTSLTTDILEIEIRDSYKYLKPAASFIFEEDAIGILKCQKDDLNFVIHPIVMYLDTYGNEAINGWDGTKLSIDEENGKYVFAPQIGAGEKDSANRFTGVVMGKDNTSINPITGKTMIGLYGYQSGINTFGLTEDGRAFFGAKSGGGQIVIDGTSAEIYGGGNSSQEGGDAENGMTITLANLNPSEPKRTEAIKVGQGKFTVYYSGEMNATGANISGSIYAQSGAIGCSNEKTKDGWIIDKYKLYSGAGNDTIALGSNPDDYFRIWAGQATPGRTYDSTKAPKSRITSPANFVVTKDGFVYMNDCYVNGEISATSGQIGGWTIKSNSLSSTNNNVGLASSGTYRFWSGADNGTAGNIPSFNKSSFFYVKSDGTICANKGTIGGWTITKTEIESGSTTLNNRGSARFGNFTITTGGTIKIDSGNTNDTTDYDDSNTNTQDSYYAPKFSVGKTGRLHCTSANIDGNVTIGGSITADNLYLRDGTSKTSSIITKNGSSSQIGGSYINCKGLSVTSNDNQSYFKVDYSGNVRIKTPHFTMVSSGGRELSADTILTSMSSIEQKADNIKLSVSGKIIKFTNADGRTSEYEQDYQTESEVESTIDTSLEGISLKVKTRNSSGSIQTSEIKLNTGGTIDISGAVTFSDLSSPGRTTINGGNITTGTISADRIDTSSIKSLSADGLTLGSTNGRLKLTAQNIEGSFDICDFSRGRFISLPSNVDIGEDSLSDYIKSFVPNTSNFVSTNDFNSLKTKHDDFEELTRSNMTDLAGRVATLESKVK